MEKGDGPKGVGWGGGGGGGVEGKGKGKRGKGGPLIPSRKKNIPYLQ